MAKLNWDKKAAGDRASHLREPERIHSETPEKLGQILQLKQIVQRIEQKEWCHFKTIGKQQKKKLSLYRQLERAYERYLTQNPSQQSSIFAKRVLSILNDAHTSRK